MVRRKIDIPCQSQTDRQLDERILRRPTTDAQYKTG